MAGLGSMDQLLVVATREVEAAGLRILELVQHRIGNLLREFQQFGIELRLEEFDERVDEERVVVEVRIEVGAAVLIGCEKAAVLPHGCMDEVERAARGGDPLIVAEHPAGARHAADHERVPRHQDLLVTARPHALFARGKSFRARRCKPRGRRRGVVRLARHDQVPVLALEVPRGVQAVVGRENGEFLRRQQSFQFVPVPDIELAFRALGVRVEARVVAALRRLHLAQHPSGGFGGDARVKRLSSRGVGIGKQIEQRPVVVKHLLEVRNGPGRIGAVAAETAAELIVDSAERHFLEGDIGHFQRVAVAVARIPAQAKGDVGRMREFRRLAPTARILIEILAQVGHRFGDRLRIEVGRVRASACRIACLHARKRESHLLALGIDFGPPLAPDRGDPLKHLCEAGQSVSRRLGEISAAEKRRAVGSEEHCERPAAGLLGQHLVRRLVDLVEVGPLFAIDLDVDEVPVHERGGRIVLEALVRHHVAPVAGGVADRKQDRGVAGAGLGKRLLAPRMPVDGVFRVLLEIRRGFLRQGVGHGT